MVERYLRVTVVAVIILRAWVSVSAEGMYEAWVARYDGPGYYWDQAYSLKLDKNGKIYVTGLSGEIVPNYSSACATIAYDSNGVAIWVDGFDMNNSWPVIPAALVVDGEGNAYVSWSRSGDCFTVKLSPLGDMLWVRYYDGVAHLDDDITAAVLDLKPLPIVKTKNRLF